MAEHVKGNTTASSENKLQATWEDYARAERFLPRNIDKLAFRLSITPNWAGRNDCFWYKVRTREGKCFMFVDPDAGVLRQAFDHEKLAAELSRATGRAYVHARLPFDAFRYTDSSLSAIVFQAEGRVWQFNLEIGELAVKDSKHLGKQSEHQDEPPYEYPAGYSEVISPDGELVAFVRDFNLYVRRTSTGEETQLTTDGEEGYHYAAPLTSPLLSAGLLKPEHALYWLRPAVVWAPDSSKILTYKIDYRDAGECYLVQSCPLDGSKRPRLHRYVYPLPGDTNVPKAEPVIINVRSGGTICTQPEQVKVKIDPVQMLYYGGPHCWTHWSAGENGRIYFMRRERGYTVKRLYVINPETGDTRVLIEEKSPTAVEHFAPRAVDDGKLVIWHSEEDGWAHLYLYDGITGELKHQITSGPWVVRGIEHVDELERIIYFSASGMEDGRDPYLRHLYRVNFDGSGLKLLTPEDAEHEITFTPSGKYFIDRYSRIDLAPVTVLRANDGTLVMELERADIELLLQTGWRFPERFTVKARDGQTDIYGMIIRPSNFDPEKKYPVIEANYSGPQTIRTPKSFGASDGSRQFWHDQAIAELGFIVVTVDGLGMAFRSKAFQDYSYKNLGDAGMPDHIAAFRQLADKNKYMDLSKVGIYGGSAGGYASCRAILEHPDFFKVAVVWAGNHDHRTDKASWIERYMGLPVGPHYEEQANPTLAGNLKGKLLIIHGDMDENVPPAASLQLVDALIKANKDFDFLILPNGIHADGFHPYITRKRWDYFVKHLLGATPPAGYAIKE
jgi:dienelactone hydrolase